ncbi:Golgi apparatus membrane TVP23 -like protein [Brachionus plicatilis]|uniref:Golgi apparatus membrane protein TVP23 homolog n=1 Tax=Brachionus plicatilis TaxID=10195 RepID=A0A3M7RNI7_BRAPC|nr:Golgi apparatus membrane TVP23 -like protein [Brachionus plicatilis]
MLADTEEVALTFEQSTHGSGNAVQTTRIRHPIASIFHLFFKSMAIFLYLFSTLFYSNFITIFVVLIIFLSMDFWTVKNITGRLLVGLRWWNHIDENGQSKWIFENRKTNQNNMSVLESTTEVTIFWLALMIADLVWITFFLVSLLTFSFKWMTIIIVALILNGSNTYGFLKCKYGSEQNIQSIATNFFGRQMIRSVFEKFSSSNQQNQAGQS